MKHLKLFVIALVVLFSAGVAKAQCGPAWSTSTSVISAATNLSGALDAKPNMQCASGAPSGLNCTIGRDLYTNTANGDIYKCTVTGTPGTFTLFGAAGAAGPSGPTGPPGTGSIASVNTLIKGGGSGSGVAALAQDVSTIQGCTDAGSTDAYACNIAPAIAGYFAGTEYWFVANTANTGTASITFNSISTLTLTKMAGGITTTLDDNDIRAGQYVTCRYDGTRCQVTSQLGNVLAKPLTGVVTATAAGVTSYTANSVNSAAEAVVNTRRICIIDNDTQSGTALTTAQLTGRCEVTAPSHIVEVGVWGGTGTGTQTYTGASSVQLTRLRPNGGSTATILSGVLATPNSGTNSNKACAVTTTSGTCINGITSSSSITLAGGTTIALNAGDVLYVSSATADTVQTWYTISIIYTVD